uniref:Uncharacterized protein n=1 Tax=Guillardia theta TaxID=55529 RepID=A0A7S4NWD6_GUITH
MIGLKEFCSVFDWNSSGGHEEMAAAAEEEVRMKRSRIRESIGAKGTNEPEDVTLAKLEGMRDLYLKHMLASTQGRSLSQTTSPRHLPALSLSRAADSSLNLLIGGEGSDKDTIFNVLLSISCLRGARPPPTPPSERSKSSPRPPKSARKLEVTRSPRVLSSS